MTRNPVTPVAPSKVTGGSHGLAAAYAQMQALATSFGSAGNRMRARAGLGRRVLTNSDLVESAILSPSSFAEAEARVLAATTGRHGLLTQSLAWEADAIAVRVMVASFEATDALVHATFEVVDYAVGRAAGFTLSSMLVLGATTAPLWLAPLAFRGAQAYAAYSLLPPPLQRRVRGVAGTTGDALSDDLRGWSRDHPGLVQHLFNGGGGVVDGFWDGLTPGAPAGPFGIAVCTPGAEDAGALLAGVYPDDGEPVVTARGDLPTTPGSPPRGLADVMRHLDEVNQWSTPGRPGNQGTIDIQTWTDAAGLRHHLVYLPGTDDLHTLPWTMDDDVRDLPTSFLAVDGQRTSYAQGILQAMHRAGISADEPVLLAGHSQGGIEAAWIASHSSDFTIAQVVTAGAPIGLMGDYPPGTQVMSFENDGDVVPLVDGEDNPDATNHVTIRFDDPAPDIGGSHALSHYIDGAAGADRSSDPSIADQIAHLHAAGFLTGRDAVGHSQAFQITRGP